MKKIEIMGCGYIGLPTAITFTLAGFEVCGFDVKQEVVNQLNGGKTCEKLNENASNSCKFSIIS